MIGTALSPSVTRPLGESASRSLARRRSRGFTLAELLVAIVAGMLVSLGAFILARNATHFFQQEARVSVAQLSANMGLQRMVTDIQRAGFLSSPNIQLDPARCQQDMTNWPPYLKTLRAITIQPDPIVGTHKSSVDNALKPEMILIGGSFTSTEEFPVRAIVANGNSYTVMLQTQTGAMYRTIVDTSSGGGSQQKLERIFATGRMLRIVDTTGKHLYGVIQGVAVQGEPPTRVDVTLASIVPLPQQVSANSCGYSGYGTGMLANPVSLVRYQLRDLFHSNDPIYAKLVGEIDAPTTIMTGDDQRLELIRAEVDANGNEVPGTLEIVAEFAVDLRFGLAFQPQGGGNAPGDFVPTQSVPILAAGPAAQLGTTVPQTIRQLQVRLVTRSRAPDRDNDPIDPANPPLDGRKLRHRIDVAGVARFARTRTLYANVALPNLAGVQW